MPTPNTLVNTLATADLTHIRNFCIVAHIDHGKSTLADRLIEHTRTVDTREMRDQLLDSMDIERERGITIKLQTVRMFHTAPNKQRYQLHLIDTPGHVDFSAEVSRSLAACEGAILLVDATQGVQAQTLANLRLALRQGLKILPVLNKIDSPLADEARVLAQLETLENVGIHNICRVSAKTGEGIAALLDAIVAHLPAPQGQRDTSPRVLVFDSHYDTYAGAVLHVRVADGQISAGTQLCFHSGGSTVGVQQVGALAPTAQACQSLHAGEVGYVATGIKTPSWVRVGDTLVAPGRTELPPIADYQQQAPMVFAGLYPADAQDLALFQDGFRKLALNDAAIRMEPEVSAAMGVGFRCGFLGLLHMEIVQERLLREFGVQAVATAPSVPYRAHLHGGTVLEIHSPQKLPGLDKLSHVEELFVTASLYTLPEHLGPLMEMCQRRRGSYASLDFLTGAQARLVYELPLAETVLSFFDELKSLTAGYATVELAVLGFRRSELVRVDILVDTAAVDAFTFISHRNDAQRRAAQVLWHLKHLLPRRLYPVPLQASIGSKVIAREDLPPLRKSALAQQFDGSVSAKKRMAQRMNDRRHKNGGAGWTKEDIPPEVFQAILGIQAPAKA